MRMRKQLPIKTFTLFYSYIIYDGKLIYAPSTKFTLFSIRKFHMVIIVVVVVIGMSVVYRWPVVLAQPSAKPTNIYSSTSLRLVTRLPTIPIECAKTKQNWFSDSNEINWYFTIYTLDGKIQFWNLLFYYYSLVIWLEFRINPRMTDGHQYYKIHPSPTCV